MSQKLKQVKVNLIPEHHEKLTYLANESGITKAQFIRKQLRATFDNPREPKDTRVHKVADPALLYHLSKMGTNLNQISRHVNEKKFIGKEVLLALLTIQNDLKKLL